MLCVWKAKRRRIDVNKSLEYESKRNVANVLRIVLLGFHESILKQFFSGYLSSNSYHITMMFIMKFDTEINQHCEKYWMACYDVIKE